MRERRRIIVGKAIFTLDCEDPGGCWTSAHEKPQNAREYHLYLGVAVQNEQTMKRLPAVKNGPLELSSDLAKEYIALKKLGKMEKWAHSSTCQR